MPLDPTLPGPPPRTPRRRTGGRRRGSLGQGRQDAVAPRRHGVNTASKGTKLELVAIKLLEAKGYAVHRCVRTSIKRGGRFFSQSNDVFGCIDLIAKKRGERTRWIQVTAHGGIGKKKADLAAVPWDALFDSVEIWRWVGGGRKRHKTTGAWLERQYFQVYHHDDGFALRPDRRVRPADMEQAVRDAADAGVAAPPTGTAAPDGTPSPAS